MPRGVPRRGSDWRTHPGHGKGAGRLRPCTVPSEEPLGNRRGGPQNLPNTSGRAGPVSQEPALEKGTGVSRQQPAPAAAGRRAPRPSQGAGAGRQQHLLWGTCRQHPYARGLPPAPGAKVKAV